MSKANHMEEYRSLGAIIDTEIKNLREAMKGHAKLYKASGCTAVSPVNDLRGILRDLESCTVRATVVVPKGAEGPTE